MPIIPQWYDEEKTVFLFHFTAEGILDWQEYRRAIDAGLAEIRRVPHPVICYFDPDQIAMPPGNPIPHLRYALEAMRPHVTAVINIINNRFAASILSWVTSFSPYTWLYIVTSKEEAEELIIQIQNDAASIQR